MDLIERKYYSLVIKFHLDHNRKKAHSIGLIVQTTLATQDEHSLFDFPNVAIGFWRYIDNSSTHFSTSAR